MPSENGLTRREELLAVATKLFAARGIIGTRMDDVADVIGLNKGGNRLRLLRQQSPILFDIYRQAAEGTLAAVHDDPSGRPARRSTSTPFAGSTPEQIPRPIPSGPPCISRQQPYITEWFTSEQVAEVREKEAQVYEHVHGLIDRGIASGEFDECDSHVVALGYIG